MDPFDLELKQSIKNWANMQEPPSNGHARLLGAAAFWKGREEKTNHFHLPSLTGDVYSWLMVYSLKQGVAALRLVS
jgi:hypothetical protein